MEYYVIKCRIGLDGYAICDTMKGNPYVYKVILLRGFFIIKNERYEGDIMDYRELLVEKYKTEFYLAFNNKSPILNETINVPGYGDMRIVSQSMHDSTVIHNGAEKVFKTFEDNDFFIEQVDVDRLSNTLDHLNILISQQPSALSLIKKLMKCWSSWERYGDFYINDLLPELMVKPEKGTDNEKKIILEIKAAISKDDWKQLPAIVSRIHSGEDPRFINDHHYKMECGIRASITDEMINDFRHRTISIIEKIIQHEIEKEQKLKAITLLNQYFELDYLNSREFWKTAEAESVEENEFDSAKRNFMQRWFEELPGNMPDDDQLAAIGALEKNVQVIARAGSGKTSTIINRARFLIEHCNVEPSSILMLAFNRKAAEEMQERLQNIMESSDGNIGILPNAMTFHALAWSIVNPDKEILYNEDEERGTLNRFIQNIIDDNIRKDDFQKKVQKLMLAHFRGAWEHIATGGYHLEKEEMLAYRRNLSHLSLRGDFVKTIEAKLVANLLFEHDVNYYYKRPFEIDNSLRVEPDFLFYSKDKKPIIIDCIINDEKAPDNLQRISYKLKNKACYIPLTEKDFIEGEKHIKDILKRFAEMHDIKFEKLSDDELWKRIKDRAIDGFTKAVTSFIGRCRKECISPEELNIRIRKYHTYNVVETMFIELAAEIYEMYIDKLEEDKKDDFDGLIIKAVAKVNGGHKAFGKRTAQARLNCLTHILIDEYQDFSLLFDSFIEAIKQHCPDAHLFCVGDDWQAINGFAGSDVKYFQNFKSRFIDTGIYEIKKNYRSVQQIVTASTSLMSPGKNSIIANRQECGTLNIGYLDKLEVSETEKACRYNLKTAGVMRITKHLLDDGKRVAILSRTKDGIPNELNDLKNELELPLQKRRYFISGISNESVDKTYLDLSTTHKYKGKEKYSVIICDGTDQAYPLIHPNWIFQRIFGDTVEKIVESEQRLFYVALTRAADELIILTTKGEESPFLKTILEKNEITTLRWNDYKSFVIGSMRGRVDVENENFYYAQPTLAIKSMLKQQGYKYDSTKRKWYTLFNPEETDITEVLEEPWVTYANRVMVSFYIDDICIHQYLIDKGCPILYY